MDPFVNVKKNFGFGCMRLPMQDEQVDLQEFTRMVDAFLEAGFHYFDTAHGYLNGLSETAIRSCLTSRYPRQQYILTNKLSGGFFRDEAGVRQVFGEQLDACGVEYFDFYLMHAQNRNNFKHFKACKAYETAFALKQEGKVRHVGLSFHDTADILDQILTEYPQIEVVQLQFNYADYDDPMVQSRLCYEVCQKHGKPVIVMEPVKGGRLVNLPENCAQAMKQLKEYSPAGYALRFAASFENIRMVLSGMGSMEMMTDNLRTMKDFRPLDDRERQTLNEVSALLRSADLIPCTACRYCLEVCPEQIRIPDLFECLNTKRQWGSDNAGYYRYIVEKSGKKPSDCIRCGACEKACPQQLSIRKLLTQVTAAYEG